MSQSDFDEQCKKAFGEGKVAKTVLDNPYWKEYPKSASVVEESKARFFVDGWCSK